MAKSKKKGIYCGAKFSSFIRLVPYFQLIVSHLLNYIEERHRVTALLFCRSAV